ncbi:histidine kinase [Spirillospora sp. NPDC029432]|uniref:sensor histidine kinase n=1 Tax=Spirillospora sp. NPDC029432 TaxID=3154599 RepID=UPI00345520A1
MHDPEPHSVLVRRLSGRRLAILDAAAAGLYTMVMSAQLSLHGGGPAEALVLALTGPPLAFRRRWPRAVCALVIAMSAAALALGMPSDAFVAAAYALYPVALTRPRSRWIPTSLIGTVSGIVLVLSPIAGPRDAWQHPGAGAAFGLALLGGSWTLGRAMRERREHAAAAARRLADRAVTDERLRIARELHDVVAHSMSLIAVKAGVAVHVAEARPQEALDALHVIEDTSRGALTEMRRLLGVLRENGEGGGAAGGGEADLVPVPGIAGLAELADRAALAGVRVDLDVRVGELPEGLALAVHRIVQESLTNIVKHAAPAAARVVVVQDDREVRVEVTDDGPGVRVLPGGAGPAGHGLIGMRERAMMYGGELTAGPRREGGFAVSARLPYDRGTQ